MGSDLGAEGCLIKVRLPAVRDFPSKRITPQHVVWAYLREDVTYSSGCADTTTMAYSGHNS